LQGKRDNHLSRVPNLEQVLTPLSFGNACSERPAGTNFVYLMRGTFGLLQAEYKRPESGGLEQQITNDAVGRAADSRRGKQLQLAFRC
jgi:hypothetical protein